MNPTFNQFMNKFRDKFTVHVYRQYLDSRLHNY